MEKTGSDKRVLHLFSAAFLFTMLSGFASGDFQKLFRHRTPQEKVAAEQRALDHLFGSDRAFNSAADQVTAEAKNKLDTVSWQMLAHAKWHMGKSHDLTPTGVEFAQDVQALDGSGVTITGYMFPLQASGNQEHFLLSAYPPSCPYCLPGGPTELIDITDSDPLRYTDGPITIHGAFQLLRGDALKDGMFYRMTHVQLQPL